MSLSRMLSPIKVGELTLKNRFIMAPLTRCRATEQHVPTPIMAKYYSDRASAGLIISEATTVTEHSAFCSEGGLYSAEQVEGWKAVTEAVHAKGGLIVAQLYHGGRAAHSLNSGLQPVAPSAVAVEGHKLNPNFVKTKEAVPYEMPRALEDGEIPGIIGMFEQAAKNAIAAGFDGVEVHGANGYLLDEFLKESSNKRTGAYGGSIENRARLLLEVTERVCKTIGAGRVGVRLSPLNSYNGQSDSNPEALTKYVCSKLSELGIAYLHMMRADFFQVQKGDAVSWSRGTFKGVLVSNMGYTAEEGEQQIADGKIDAVAFGTKFLANPDLPYRCEKGLALNDLNPDLFYTAGEKGYNDYPFAN